MSFTVTTDKGVKGESVHIVTPEVFNQVSELGGYGIKVTGAEFNSHSGGLAVNSDTPNFDKIKALIGGKEDKKEGAK